MGIKEIHTKLNKFNLDSETAKNIKQHNQIFTDVNRKQMLAGKKGSGNMQDYDPDFKVQIKGKFVNYRDYKRTLSSYNAPFPQWNLFLTGAFQNKMFVKVNGSSLIFDSRDKKRNDLVKWGGKSIFELDKESTNEAQQINEHYLTKKIHDIFLS